MRGRLRNSYFQHEGKWVYHIDEHDGTDWNLINSGSRDTKDEAIEAAREWATRELNGGDTSVDVQRSPLVVG